MLFLFPFPTNIKEEENNEISDEPNDIQQTPAEDRLGYYPTSQAVGNTGWAPNWVPVPGYPPNQVMLAVDPKGNPAIKMGMLDFMNALQKVLVLLPSFPKIPIPTLTVTVDPGTSASGGPENIFQFILALIPSLPIPMLTIPKVTVQFGAAPVSEGASPAAKSAQPLDFVSMLLAAVKEKTNFVQNLTSTLFGSKSTTTAAPPTVAPSGGWGPVVAAPVPPPKPSYGWAPQPVATIPSYGWQQQPPAPAPTYWPSQAPSVAPTYGVPPPVPTYGVPQPAPTYGVAAPTQTPFGIPQPLPGFGPSPSPTVPQYIGGSPVQANPGYPSSSLQVPRANTQPFSNGQWLQNMFYQQQLANQASPKAPPPTSSIPQSSATPRNSLQNSAEVRSNYPAQGVSVPISSPPGEDYWNALWKYVNANYTAARGQQSVTQEPSTNILPPLSPQGREESESNAINDSNLNNDSTLNDPNSSQPTTEANDLESIHSAPNEQNNPNPMNAIDIDDKVIRQMYSDLFTKTIAETSTAPTMASASSGEGAGGGDNMLASASTLGSHVFRRTFTPSISNASTTEMPSTLNSTIGVNVTNSDSAVVSTVIRKKRLRLRRKWKAHMPTDEPEASGSHSIPKVEKSDQQQQSSDSEETDNITFSETIQIVEPPTSSTTEEPAASQVFTNSSEITTEIPENTSPSESEDYVNLNTGLSGVTETIKVDLPFSPMPENNELWNLLHSQPIQRRKRRNIKNDVILDSGKSHGLVDNDEKHAA